MHFKAIPTPKPRTPKQNAQEAQIPIKALAITATITTAIIAITTAVTTTITIAVITAIKATPKKAKGKVKGKAKGRALSLERWHKRLSHFNYADVKQLATHSS
jgi:hypothetical protein